MIGNSQIEESTQQVEEEQIQPVAQQPEFDDVVKRPWTVKRIGVYALVGLVALFLLLTFSIPSLLRSRQSAQETGGRPAATQPVSFQQGQPTLTPSPAGPMIIRTVRLTVISNDFETARLKIDDVVRQSQGYIDHLTVRAAGSGSVRSLSAALRVPAAQLEFGLGELKKLGRLMEETQTSSEITGQYVDLIARLNNARNSEQRLLTLLRERAGNLKDVIEMEREIASVRENIERMEAQRNDLNNKVQFATIQFELTEEYHAPPEPPAPTTITQLRSAFVDGIRSAGDNALDITLFALRYGPAALVWSLVLGSIAFALWRLHLVHLKRA